jgi:hypothetical protein
MRIGFIVKLVLALLLLVAVAPKSCAQVMLPHRASHGVLASGCLYSSLNTNLVAYWNMNELSAGASPVVRSDCVGTNHLADPLNIPSATGVISLAIDQDSATNPRLTCVSSPELQMGNIDFTFSFWAKLETIKAGVVISKGSISGSFEYAVRVVDIGGFRWNWDINNGAQNIAWGSTVATNTLYHVLSWYDSVGDKMWLRVNNGVSVSANYTLGAPTTATGFTIGNNGAPSAALAFNGLIDEVAIWKRVLTTDEQDALWNSGNAIAGCSYCL